MAILAAYTEHREESLEDFLAGHVFKVTRSTTVRPDRADVEGFNSYLEKFREGLAAQASAIEKI